MSPHGATYSHVGYDSLGRRAWQSEQTTYSDGNDPSIIGKEFEYDDTGRLRAVILPDVNDPCNSDTPTYPRYEYDYDKYGNLTCIRDNIKQYADHTIDANYVRETRFTYDPLHSQTSRRLPDGRIEFKQYDNFGRLKKSTDFAAQITGFEYSGCCSLLDYKRYYVDESAYIADNHTSEIQYTYDNFRRKNQVYVDDVLQQDFYYDSEGRIEALYSPQGWIKYEYHMVTGARKSISAFDASLNYGELTSANADTKVSYAYDELARLKTVTVNKRNGQDVNEVAEYTYNPVGSAKNVVYANGNLAEYSYDALNRLTNLTNYQDYTKATMLSSFAYTLGPDGTRQTVTESDGTVITWTYDNLKRLTEEDYDAPGSADDYTHGYIYDLVANRLKRSVDGGADTVYTYGPNNDRLLTETTDGNTITYYYDDNGALIKRVYGTDPNADPNDSYQYNLFGRLSEAAPNGLSTVTYTYNADGLRVRKQIDGGPIIELLIDQHNHTGYSQVLKEIVSNDANIVYIIGLDVLAQSVEGTDPNYFLYDGQGSVRHLTDYTGALTSAQAYNFDAYGNLINAVTPQTNLLYTGEMWDGDIAGYNLRARDYRPDVGLFMTMDAFAGNHLDPLSLHKYTYAHGNPTNRTDPSGNFTINTVGLLQSITITNILMSNIVMNVDTSAATKQRDCGVWTLYASYPHNEGSQRRHELYNKGVDYVKFAFSMERLNYNTVRKVMRRYRCGCFGKVRVFDHGLKNKETGTVEQGWSFRKSGTKMDPHDVEQICPFLCKDSMLKLMGCDMGDNSRSAFLEYFNVCRQISKIEACTGDVKLKTGRCPFGWWKTFER